MRKLILGVSLWWPVIVAISAVAAIAIVVGMGSAWARLMPVPLLLGGFWLWDRFWVPYFRGTKFGIAMTTEINERYNRIAMNHGDVYGQMSLSERIFDKLCSNRHGEQTLEDRIKDEQLYR